MAVKLQKQEFMLKYYPNTQYAILNTTFSLHLQNTNF